jgi:hypothetical protein
VTCTSGAAVVLPRERTVRIGLCAPLVLIAGVLAAPRAAAQVPCEPGGPIPRPYSALFHAAPPAAVPTGLFARAGEQAAATDLNDRACPACPRRRPAAAFLQALGVNVAFNLANRLRNPNDEFKVTPSSWWENLRYGFEWDYNSFSINQFGHPYQGTLYFNAGRANGLSFWESAPLAALGSATWEYFGERNHASINDFVTTTMGGIALGEIFHRAGWLIRDARESGGARMRGEIIAMLVDPIAGANRFMSGDASRVSENPPGLKPPFVTGDFDVGVQWNGQPNQRVVKSTGEPFVGLRLGYADIFSTPFKTPYDAFGVSLLIGGGSPISEASVRGRLYGRFFGNPGNRAQFLVAQAYDYQATGIFDYGGQSIVAGLSRVFRPSASSEVAAFGVGGPILLGAITSPIAGGYPTPHEGEVSQRNYDFGPGAEVAGGAVLRIGGFPVGRLTYASFYLRTASSIEGIAGQHYAQVARADALVPLWRQFRLGFSGSYINRATYYQDIPDVHQWIPEFRVFVAKVSR